MGEIAFALEPGAVAAKSMIALELVVVSVVSRITLPGLIQDVSASATGGFRLSIR